MQNVNQQRNMFVKKLFIAVLAMLQMALMAPAILHAQENIQFFGSEPLAGEQDKGRGLLGCLDGWRQFLSAFIGYEGFVDYWRDIFVLSWKWPMYFADINNVEMQLNKSRYAVMSAFMRCDTDRLASVTQAYYKLEAELYFLRHFVDVSGGILNFQTESRGNRNRFRDEMLDYFVIRKESENPDQDKALFSGYFDQFDGKYAGRAEQYSGYGDDPIYSDISSKFDSLIKTFKDFGHEAKELGGDVAQAGADALKAGKGALDAGVNAFEHPLSALGDIASDLNSRFQVCPSAGHPDECKTIDEVAKAAVSEAVEDAQKFGKLSLTLVGGVVATPIGIGKASVEKIIDLVTEGGTKVTPEEVAKITEELEKVSATQLERADMLTRYELLYGQVGGDGVIAITNKMDQLMKILGPEESLPKLEKAAECAAFVQNSVCSSL